MTQLAMPKTRIVVLVKEIRKRLNDPSPFCLLFLEVARLRGAAFFCLVTMLAAC